MTVHHAVAFAGMGRDVRLIVGRADGKDARHESELVPLPGRATTATSSSSIGGGQGHPG
jgi:hypothetical protein